MLISQSLPDSQPPATLDAHLCDCERFFDRYSSVVDAWHARNRGYHACRHCAVAGDED